MGGQYFAPAPLPPKEASVPFVQESGWTPSAGLEGCGKPRPPPGHETRTVHLVRVTKLNTLSLPPMDKHFWLNFTSEASTSYEIIIIEFGLQSL
jgi:hypothetical protein